MYKRQDLIPLIEHRQIDLTDQYIVNGWALITPKKLWSFFANYIEGEVEDYIDELYDKFSKDGPPSDVLEEVGERISENLPEDTKITEAAESKGGKLRQECFPPCVKKTLQGVGEGNRNYAVIVLLTSFLSYARISPSGKSVNRVADFVDDISVIEDEVVPLILEASENCRPPLFKDQPQDKANVYYHMGFGMTTQPRLRDSGKSKWYRPPNCRKIKTESPALCNPDELCSDVKNPLTYYYKRYYRDEWDVKDLPDYLLHTLSLREFGFDHDGEGPNDRYNQFMTQDELSKFMKERYPYASYSSVALYERPSERKKWIKSELAFDIDAKDLPFKRCDCTGGEVCELCLEDARHVTATFAETLSSDLGLDDIHFVYSGRGFHIRVFDDSVMEMGQAGRSQVVEYVTGNVVPSDFTMALGYSQVFRKRALRTFEKLEKEDLQDVGMWHAAAKRLMEEKERVMKKIEQGRIEDIRNIEKIGKKSFEKLIELITRLNSEHTDGKVTIDKKRILRVPSSLHSTVSRKCIEIPDIDSFSFDRAVPDFLR